MSICNLIAVSISPFVNPVISGSYVDITSSCKYVYSGSTNSGVIATGVLGSIILFLILSLSWSVIICPSTGFNEMNTLPYIGGSFFSPPQTATDCILELLCNINDL